MPGWNERIQSGTETYLTWRKRRTWRKKEKQKKKNPVVDWLEAFLWAAGVVLLINQYLFQAYQIPSGSMMETLLIKDRIFVNKLVYGPELIPGMGKLPSPVKPERGEVIIFESPVYLSKGPAFDVLQRLLYMLTLSLVDIDRDEYGQPRAHFLIKRAVGVAGDRVRFNRGNVELMPPGYENWVEEETYKAEQGMEYTARRLVNRKTYDDILASARADAYLYAGIAPEAADLEAAGNTSTAGEDMFAWSGYRYETLYALNPQSRRYGSTWRRWEMGWYLPEGWIFPLGDNRDRSKDARYFGPVRLKKVLGRAMFKYWPLHRIGGIH